MQLTLFFIFLLFSATTAHFNRQFYLSFDDTDIHATAIDDNGNIYWTGISNGSLFFTNNQFIKEIPGNECIIKVVDLQIETSMALLLISYTNCSQINLWDNQSFSAVSTDQNTLFVQSTLNGTIIRIINIEAFSATSIQMNNPTHYGLSGNVIQNNCSAGRLTWLNRITFEFEETIVFNPLIGNLYLTSLTWRHPIAYISGWTNNSFIDVGGINPIIAPTYTYELSGMSGIHVFSIAFDYQYRNVTSLHYQTGDNITWAASGSNYLAVNAPNKLSLWKFFDGSAFNMSGEILDSDDDYFMVKTNDTFQIYFNQTLILEEPLLSEPPTQIIVKNDHILIASSSYIQLYGPVSSPVIDCDLQVRPQPADNFYCETGEWITNSTIIVTENITVNTSVTIRGDLVIKNNASIILSTGTSIVVLGCLKLDGYLLVDQTVNHSNLFSAPSGCIEGNFREIITNDSCALGQLERNGNSLDLLFTLGCNLTENNSGVDFLIPLICVCVAIVLIIVIVIVIMKNKNLRAKLMPFSMRRALQNAQTMEV